MYGSRRPYGPPHHDIHLTPVEQVAAEHFPDRVLSVVGVTVTVEPMVLAAAGLRTVVAVLQLAVPPALKFWWTRVAALAVVG